MSLTSPTHPYEHERDTNAVIGPDLMMRAARGHIVLYEASGRLLGDFDDPAAAWAALDAAEAL